MVPSLIEINLDLPALQGGEALIHPEQVAGEKRGLVAAGAGADFQHDVAIVHRVLGQQRHADLLCSSTLRASSVSRSVCAMARISGSVAGSAISASIPAIFGIGGAVGFHSVDQRI